MRRHVRPTSIQAFLSIRNLGERQQTVYNAIKERTLKGIYLTDLELATELGFQDPNAVRPRRYDLMQLGIVEEVDKRLCTISHKLALTWQAVNIKPILHIEGNRAIQTEYIPPEDWFKLRDFMVQQGYIYQGQGVWDKHDRH